MACSLFIRKQTVNIFKMNNLKNVMGNFPLANQNHEQLSTELINSTLQTNIKIEDGLCKNCDYKNACVWQHNNKLFCEHLN
jgi:hypothetical protein